MFLFAAYPSSCPPVMNIIESIAQATKGTEITVHPWSENDVVGRPLIDPILENIDKSDAVICDITRLNFNVIFEAGYAIGKKKRLILTLNKAISNDMNQFQKIGIFDTIGFTTYQNSSDFSELVKEETKSAKNALFVEFQKNFKNPVYVVELPKKTDVQTRIESRIKRARLRYRSFSAQEHVRLSALGAIESVASSSGVVVPLASPDLDQASEHNIRAAFVAGLAHALGKPLAILQDVDGPAPLDIRDVVQSFRELDGINSIIAKFADRVVEEMQSADPDVDADHPALADLVLGDPMAENEMTTLGRHYVNTDEFLRVTRGEANVVVGRKGMGKTALFIRTRDRHRRVVDKIVVDLKPEGYQLKKMREDVFDLLSKASVDHLITAFWEYLLYIEICNKILEKDEIRSRNDHQLRPLYRQLVDIREKLPFAEEGDFSERLYALVADVVEKIEVLGLRGSDNRLTTENITEIIHSHQLPSLRQTLIDYLRHKESLWILFDNLDKGWPTQGIESTDAVILRSLIDASKKIRRELNKSGIEAYAIVFVRNDVYELLIQNSADFGKEIRVHLDWADPDSLRRLVQKRLAGNDNEEFESVWEKYFSRLTLGEYSFDYVLQRSLYRPRNIIKIIYNSRSFAVNARQRLIEENSIIKGLSVYSSDVLEEADEELSDIIPKARGLLYNFIGESASFGEKELRKIIESHFEASEDDIRRVVDALLYYGFIGGQKLGGEPRYIYDFSYKMKLLQAWISKDPGTVRYVLNPAFWSALEVTG